MGTKHTPGPWTKASAGFERRRDLLAHVGGKPVTVAENFRTEADRDLCRVAPELLAALVAVTAALLACRPISPEPLAARARSAIETASAAIAKAEGR